jgi:hypothetical protein
LYVQNIIISYKCQNTQLELIKEEDITRLQELHALMEEKIALYHVGWEAKGQNKNTFEKRKLMFLASIQHNSIAGGKQHQYLIPEILSTLLEPHNLVLQKLFGLTALQLVGTITLIQKSLIKGIGIAGSQLTALWQEWVESGKTIQECMQLKQNPEIVSSFRQFGRFDLHDLQKIAHFPQNLLDELSLSVGENTSFLSGSNAGWPIKPFPSLFKPFIKVDGRYYCFHIWNFTDNIYRALYQIIIKADVTYKKKWSDYQGLAVEKYTFKLFKEMLPDAEIYEKMYYYTDPNDKGSRCEVDGLIFINDHLLIVEIKGGEHSQKSPTTHPKSVHQSAEKLVGKAYDQGMRLFECLEKYKDGVQLYSELDVLIKEIKLSDYKHVTICCITLEQVAGTEGNLNSLKALNRNVNLAKSNIWLLSVDDLVVYSKLIPNSLTFCDFLEKRHRVLKLDVLHSFDELCHYGAYLKHDDYAEYFAELSKKNEVILPDSLRHDIIAYLDSLLAETPIPRLLPSIHPIVRRDICSGMGGILGIPSLLEGDSAPRHIRADGKIGVNARCPCGSGNKYKNCHGAT